MQQNWDELDKRMLKSIMGHPGMSIRDVIRPFLRELSETALRQRVRALCLQDLIELRPGVSKVECYPLVNNIQKIEGMQDTLGGVQI